MKFKVLRVVAVAGAVAAGCADSMATEPASLDDARFVGILELVESEPRPVTELQNQRPMVAPDTVDTGVPFAVTIATIGLNTCWQEAGVTVAVEPRRVTLTPFDRIVGQGNSQATGCREALIGLPRTVNLVFTQRGEATLRVEGRRVYGRATSNTTSFALEKRIHVR